MPRESHPRQLLHRNLLWLLFTFLKASPLPSLSGPVTSDVLLNGNGLVDGFDASGDTLINGSLPQTALPQSTSSPINLQTQEPSPGVAANQPMMLEKSEGASAEVTVHKGEALQSLRLSMPMQETELCKHKIIWSELPPPPINLLYFNLIFLGNVLLSDSCASSCSPRVCVIYEQKDQGESL